eukprot:751712-Hanusia_phi.AAC.1
MAQCHFELPAALALPSSSPSSILLFLLPVPFLLISVLVFPAHRSVHLLLTSSFVPLSLA